MTYLFKKEYEKKHTIYKVLGLKFKFRNTPLGKRDILLKEKRKKYKLKKFFAKFCPCKKYKYIIPFGSNCIFSFKFREYFRFVDSTFWNWVAAHNPEVQIELMNNFDILFSQGLEKHFDSTLWSCTKTGLQFHGRGLKVLNDDGSINEEQLEKEKEELISRTKYLYQKTNRYLDSDDKKLIIYTLSLYDKNFLEKLCNRLNTLYEYLLTRTKNFDFLIVCQNLQFETINRIVHTKHPEIYIRQVKTKYAKEKWKRMYFDIFGWADIFQEFRPEKIIKPKYKELKFNQLEHNKLNE